MSFFLFIRFVRMRWKALMAYRSAFIIGAISQIGGYGANYFVIWLLLLKFETIDNWTWPEVALLYSINLFTYALGASLAFNLTYELEELIISGNMDKYLTKPLHPFWFLVANTFNPGYIAHILISGAFLIWALTQTSVQWTIIPILFMLIVIINGALLQASLFILFGSWAFLFTRSRFITMLYHELRGFISYPISIYGTFIQVLLTFVVPLAFINFYPGLWLLDKTDGMFPSWYGWFILIVGPMFFWFTIKLWLLGVNKYQGAGG